MHQNKRQEPYKYHKDKYFVGWCGIISTIQKITLSIMQKSNSKTRPKENQASITNPSASSQAQLSSSFIWFVSKALQTSLCKCILILSIGSIS